MNLSPLVASTTREHDILLGPPVRVSLELAVRLPPGHRVVETPHPVTLDHPFGSFSSTVEITDGLARLSRTLILRSHRIPKSDYAAFREFAAAIDLSAKEKLVIAPE
jgi:hypothetical protein